MKATSFRKTLCLILVLISLITTIPPGAFATEADSEVVSTTSEPTLAVEAKPTPESKPTETVVEIEPPTEPTTPVTEAVQEDPTASTEAPKEEKPTAPSEPAEETKPAGSETPDEEATTEKPTAPESGETEEMPEDQENIDTMLQPTDEEFMEMLADTIIDTYANATTYPVTYKDALYQPDSYKGSTPRGTHNFEFIQRRRVKYGSKLYPAYCLDPGPAAATGNVEGKDDVDYNDSGWNTGLADNLSTAQRRAISLILMYGYPNHFSNSEDTWRGKAYECATQVLIWEIVCGYRKATYPYTRTNNGLYKACATSNDSTFWCYFDDSYANIVKWVVTHDPNLSFSSQDESTAPIHTMTDNGDGTYSITLTDTSSVMWRYTSKNDGTGTFMTEDTNNGTLKYSVSGSKLTITSTAPINEPILITADKRNVKSLTVPSFLILHNSSGTNQTQVAMVCQVLGDPVPTYFSLQTPAPESCEVDIIKTTSDGNNLSGWEFNLVDGDGNVVASGSTNEEGKVSLYAPAGDYFVVEVVPDGSAYTCTENNKEVTLSGIPTEVTFFNELKTGKVKIQKETNTGTDLAGWEFGVYSDEDCTNLLGTMITGEDGTAISGDLPCGNVYIAEITTKEGWDSDVSVEEVTILANQTVELATAFKNFQLGKARLKKDTNTGNDLAGWQFGVYGDANLEYELEIITTDETGYATTSYLRPGTVYIKELSTKEGWATDTTVKEVTITAGQIVDVSTAFTNTQLGKVSLTKNTNTGNDLGGWDFGIYSDAGCTTLLETITTDNTGFATSGWLTPGTVYIKEITTKEGWISETTVKTVTILPGQTVAVASAFINVQQGRVTITKSTNTGNDLGGWQFGVYSDAECSVLIDTITTDDTGSGTSNWLTPGTVYIKEITTKEGWNSDTTVQTVTIVAGQNVTPAVAFSNTQLGKVQLLKNTNTGVDLAGWEFGIYLDATCTQLLETVTTDENGTATSGWLAPGVVYIREITTKEGWTSDDSIKSIVIVPGVTATLAEAFVNVHLGDIIITKTTNTGKDLGSWIVDLKDKDLNLIQSYTMPNTGILEIKDLVPGTYYVTEHDKNDPYWVCDTEQKEVTVVAGQDAAVTIANVQNGLAKVKKETNTGVNLEGWEFSFFSDEVCTQLVTKLTSDANGDCSEYLLPGTYWVKETGFGIYSDEYWTYDDEVKQIVVAAGEEASVSFKNLHNGKILIKKELATDGSLEGWQFYVQKVERGFITSGNIGSGGNNEDFTTEETEILFEVGTFTTLEDGTFLTEQLEPGNYRIEEIIPEDSLYYCKTNNPVDVTVKEGETATVSFTNALRPGRIEIKKVNVLSKPLSDAKFLLEWSEDGTTWKPVVYSDTEDVVKGGCSNADVTDGIQITGSTGIIIYENLYPGLQYRVTELEAPSGYVLLKDYAFVGELPIDTLEVKLQVINSPGYTLPKTGSTSMTTTVTMGAALVCFAMLTCATLLGALDHKSRKNPKNH